MGKHDDFDDFFEKDDNTSVADTRADGRLYRVPLGRLAPNLVNPRTEFGTEDDLIDFGKSLARRQNQPCPVVSRSAYLKLWPDHADRIGDVDYVLVSGERRYRGATAVGLPVLDCVANDDFATDRKTFMEAVVAENVDRKNFDPVEEAYAVQALVAEFGSNRAVAQHFDRVDGWVTQRLQLTHLAREMQVLVRDKTIPVEAARKLGKLARDNKWAAQEQMQWWENEKVRRANATLAAKTVKAAKKASSRQAAQSDTIQDEVAVQLQEQPSAQSFTTVKLETAVPPTPTALPEQTVPLSEATVTDQTQSEPDSKDSPPEPQSATVTELPEPRDATQPEADRQPARRFPYDNGGEAALLILRHMQPGERARLLSALARDEDTKTAASA